MAFTRLFTARRAVGTAVALLITGCKTTPPATQNASAGERAVDAGPKDRVRGDLLSGDVQRTCAATGEQEKGHYCWCAECSKPDGSNDSGVELHVFVPAKFDRTSPPLSYDEVMKRLYAGEALGFYQENWQAECARGPHVQANEPYQSGPPPPLPAVIIVRTDDKRMYGCYFDDPKTVPVAACPTTALPSEALPEINGVLYYKENAPGSEKYHYIFVPCEINKTNTGQQDYQWAFGQAARDASSFVQFDGSHDPKNPHRTYTLRYKP